LCRVSVRRVEEYFPNHIGRKKIEDRPYEPNRADRPDQRENQSGGEFFKRHPRNFAHRSDETNRDFLQRQSRLLYELGQHLQQFGRAQAKGADEHDDERGPNDQRRFNGQTGAKRSKRAQSDHEEPKESFPEGQSRLGYAEA
jgi:hypothetical protein